MFPTYLQFPSSNDFAEIMDSFIITWVAAKSTNLIFNINAPPIKPRVVNGPGKPAKCSFVFIRQILKGRFAVKVCEYFFIGHLFTWFCCG